MEFEAQTRKNEKGENILEMGDDKIQVLCLHGKRQNGEIFSQRLEKLTRRLAPGVTHYECSLLRNAPYFSSVTIITPHY